MSVYRVCGDPQLRIRVTHRPQNRRRVSPHAGAAGGAGGEEEAGEGGGGAGWSGVAGFARALRRDSSARTVRVCSASRAAQSRTFPWLGKLASSARESTARQEQGTGASQASFTLCPSAVLVRNNPREWHLWSAITRSGQHVSADFVYARAQRILVVQSAEYCF